MDHRHSAGDRDHRDPESTVMEFLVVLGAGESGVGTAILGIQEGYKVFVSDFGSIQQKYKDVLEHFGINWEEHKHSADILLQADLVMKSPGIPDSAPIVQQIIEKGIPVISEIEFAARYTDATIIGITGSNGKTTTTMLTYHLLKSGGLNVGMAGNIGDSFAKMVAEHNYDHYVLEISSFQLDGIRDFAPHIAVITNISPDHLDRYNDDMSEYVRSKFRITENQTESDYFIYDQDNDDIQEGLVRFPIHAKKLPFTLSEIVEEGSGIKEKNIQINIGDNTLEMSIDIVPLQGKHNLKNTMAAATVASLMGIRDDVIRKSIITFQGAPHRLEHVLKIHHVNYINDSKATNVNATYYALESMTGPTVWIVGGLDKGNDYSELMPLVREKVKAIVCLGLDNSKLKEAFGHVVEPFVETYAMSEAVKVAYKIAERGDTVLLSPACASFDLFRNYEDRGDQFKEAIKNL